MMTFLWVSPDGDFVFWVHKEVFLAMNSLRLYILLIHHFNIKEDSNTKISLILTWMLHFLLQKVCTAPQNLKVQTGAANTHM